MQDENNVPVEETKVPEAEKVDTTEESKTTSQPEDSEAHEEEQKEAISKEEFKRLQIKAQKLESEKAQIAKQNAVYGEYVLEDEDRTRAYLKRQGLDEQQITTALDRIRQQRPDIWQKEDVKEADVASEQKALTPTAPIDIKKIKQEIRDEITFDTYVKQSQAEFMAAVPEMDPKNYVNASEEDRQLVEQLAGEVDYLAKALMKIRPLSYKDALISSYNTLRSQMSGNKEEEIKREGYIEGLAEKNADNATSFGEMSGGTEKAKSVELTQIERNYAKKLGMSEEEYAKYKR